MRRHSKLQLVEVRGFRIISGGILRHLEHFRWWWKFNRWLAAKVPALCIEIQAIMEKPAAEPSRRELSQEQASNCKDRAEVAAALSQSYT